MKKQVNITSHDGGSFNALMIRPDTDLPAPAVVVIQEIFGINENMQKVCEHLSQAGYITICPDLFWRQEPDVQLSDKIEADMQKAFQLYQGFNIDLGVEDLKATLAFIRADKGCTGKAATIGYCLGGKLAWLMAARADADCNISYYGVGIEDTLSEAKNIKKPLLMHIAENDQFVPLEAQEKILHTMNGMKNVELHVYPGVDHAFARQGGDHYDKEAAHQANYHTADFLATYLDRKQK
jgi:carboxymethylenebutenolidase